MNRKNTTNRYGSLSIALHWLMLLLFVAVYASIELSGAFAKGSDSRLAMQALHFSFGLLIFLMVWLRLAVRLVSSMRHPERSTPVWQRHAAGLAHAALYALMIAMPLLGWLALGAAGKPVSFFGLELAALIDENAGLAKPIRKVHETVGSAAYLLIGLHAALALFHHNVRGDDTLRRMLPKRA